MPKLTVLSIAYPFSHLGPDSAGGAEQVLSLLEESIVAAGHRSIVIAREGSRVAGQLLSVPAEEAMLDGPAVGRAHAWVIQATAEVLAHERVDVVHTHGIDFDRYLPAPGVPVVATLHLPPSWYSRDTLILSRPDTHLCCVSESQRSSLPAWANEAALVPNGVRVERLATRSRKAEYCLMLTRICPEKGVHEALDAATLAGIPLLVAGDVSSWPAHRRYFENEVKSRLKNGHRFLGFVTGARKRRLLAAARAVLIPSRVPETSSLVAMEALASGVPVIVYASGALPSVVEHGRTGFVVDDSQSMAAAIQRVHEIDPSLCRAVAAARFSARPMTAGYLSLYERAVRQRALGTKARSSGLEIEEARGLFALSRIEREWSDLADRVGASPFQRPEWLLPYARVFCQDGSSAEPHALILRSHGALVGLMPLCTRESGSERCVSLLGESISDYLDVLVDPRHRETAPPQLLTALAARERGDPRYVFDELRPGSPLLRARSPEPMTSELSDRGPCPVLRLPAGLDAIPSSMRDKVRYYRRRAERLGSVSVEITDSRNLDFWLEKLFELHAARWSSRGEPGVLASTEVREFQSQAVRALAATNCASIFGLRIGEQPIAATLVLHDASTAYYYIGGFDPAFVGVSPGTLLIAHAIDWARGRGCCEFDFLRGSEAYKYHFGATDRMNRCRRLSPRVETRVIARDSANDRPESAYPNLSSSLQPA